MKRAAIDNDSAIPSAKKSKLQELVEQDVKETEDLEEGLDEVENEIDLVKAQAEEVVEEIQELKEVGDIQQDGNVAKAILEKDEELDDIVDEVEELQEEKEELEEELDEHIKESLEKY